MKKINLKIEGMHCKSCKMLIEDVLLETEGIKKAEVDLENGAATVEFDEKKVSEKQIKVLIAKEGYNAQ